MHTSERYIETGKNCLSLHALSEQSFPVLGSTKAIMQVFTAIERFLSDIQISEISMLRPKGCEYCALGQLTSAQLMFNSHEDFHGAFCGNLKGKG